MEVFVIDSLIHDLGHKVNTGFVKSLMEEIGGDLPRYIHEKTYIVLPYGRARYCTLFELCLEIMWLKKVEKN